jgi:uncharacterized membrane protein
MYEDTPNEEYIDRWLEKMRERYQFDRLKQMSKGRLEGMEFKIESEFTIFKSGFPPSESGLQDKRRAIMRGNNNDTKEALTPAEKERLRQAKSDLKHEVYRARGEREKQRRKHRSDLMNSVVDTANAVSRSILGLWATVKELTPW